METRNRAILFQGLVVDIEQMEVRIGEKGWHTYQVVRHPGGAAVLPLHEDGTVTLIRQLRPAVDAFMLEAPAGASSPAKSRPAARCGNLPRRPAWRRENSNPSACFIPLPGFLTR